MTVKPLFGDIKAACFSWQSPSYINQCFYENDMACFLGEQGSLKEDADWNCSTKTKLWLYNAHYFDDLNAINSDSRVELQLRFMHRWVEQNPAILGNGWEPYPISLRLVNWIKFLARENQKEPVFLNSMHCQTEVLMQQLEYHILGNHLFANAKALVFVGVFLDCDRSSVYLKKGLSLLDREIEEQFLEDGGHFERSPMYHSILLWDLLDLINLAQRSGNKDLLSRVVKWKNIAEKALKWLLVMAHPDGEVSFFNDAAIGIAAPPQLLCDYAAQCGVSIAEESCASKVVTLKESGYSRVEMPSHVTFFDHAPIGPDYLPGHAHADTLSVEWSVGNHRVLVNSGTSLYGESVERLRQRSTAAHNTVVINSENSSEVWGGFRVARRATAVLESVSESSESVELLASHDGYTRLKGRPVHRRKLCVTASGLEIIDTIEGGFDSAYALFHLHPDIIVIKVDESCVELHLCDGKSVLVNASSSIEVADSSWHPEFGVTIVSKKLIIPLCATSLSISFSIK